MTRGRRFGAAAVMAAFIAGGILAASVPLFPLRFPTSTTVATGSATTGVALQNIATVAATARLDLLRPDTTHRADRRRHAAAELFLGWRRPGTLQPSEERPWQRGAFAHPAWSLPNRWQSVRQPRC